MEDNTTQSAPADLFNEHTRFTEATKGQRFVNWLVDNVLIRLIVTYFTGELFASFLLDVAPEFTYRAFGGDGQNFMGILVSYGFGLFHYLFYYTICEKAFKGYTLGKLLSGTRAIRTDGQELTFKDVILRTLSRMVPFEVFSALGDGAPWHDTWTKTMVIKAR
ncbi:MAG: RDD family protein [Chitinophagaceae bacterium]|nr:RDD family protein [Chitinophagaceae bacterium]